MSYHRAAERLEKKDESLQEDGLSAAEAILFFFEAGIHAADLDQIAADQNHALL
jgi:hypothetical protein